jgi:hypothetical protein
VSGVLVVSKEKKPTAITKEVKSTAITNEADFLKEVMKVVRAHRKEHDDTEGVVIALQEQLGVLGVALTEKPWEVVYDTALKIAALSLRVALEGDATLAFLRYERFGPEIEFDEDYDGDDVDDPNHEDGE